ncbi:Calcium-binding EF-hand [Corchorus olitorius]|uniref:Calcium-binding EF-hand n=1 Tax=Corchorus olitorius TaxID=93759 RepID=A0A1R3K0Y0_9ROSI|nr:Calcium-binding EF-hand [Corchorus olitorius]
MARRKISNSESEESENEEKSSEEEEEEENPKQGKQVISEYEKQRLSRIAENRARMEAMGLTKMASSLMGSLQNSSQNSGKVKGKRKVVEEDEDYQPNDEEEHEEDDDDDDDKLEGDGTGDDDEYLPAKKKPHSQSQSRKTKVKTKDPKPKKKAPLQKHLASSDYVDDDDELMKAIALSLQDSGEVAGAVHRNVKEATLTERKGNTPSKKKKSFTSRVQMTEDEMVVHFFHFDEAGKGGISRRDLRRVAMEHDFMWTDKELSDMIHCFDGDSDGKLNLDDFRRIIRRCNMLRTSENS